MNVEYINSFTMHGRHPSEGRKIRGNCPRNPYWGSGRRRAFYSLSEADMIYILSNFKAQLVSGVIY